MRKLLESAAEAAIQYLEKIDARKVAPAAEAVDNLDLFRESLSEKTTAPETVLTILNDLGSPATMAMAGPRFFGFVIRQKVLKKPAEKYGRVTNKGIG
jgi:hypothetical protein